MQVIPVIDLMGGEVVRARMGDRASYRPIESPLSPTSDPVDVVRGLLAAYPFPTLYVADLDAIRARGRQFRRAAPHSRRVSSVADVDRQWRGGPGRARGSHRRRSRRAGPRQRIAARRRADRAAQGLGGSCSRSIFAATRFRAPRRSWPNPALAAPGHRHDPRARRRRRRPGSRAACRDRIDRGRARNLRGGRRARRRRSRARSKPRARRAR